MRTIGAGARPGPGSRPASAARARSPARTGGLDQLHWGLPHQEPEIAPAHSRPARGALCLGYRRPRSQLAAAPRPKMPAVSVAPRKINAPGFRRALPGASTPTLGLAAPGVSSRTAFASREPPGPFPSGASPGHPHRRQPAPPAVPAAVCASPSTWPPGCRQWPNRTGPRSQSPLRAAVAVEPSTYSNSEQGGPAQSSARRVHTQCVRVSRLAMSVRLHCCGPGPGRCIAVRPATRRQPRRQRRQTRGESNLALEMRLHKGVCHVQVAPLAVSDHPRAVSPRAVSIRRLTSRLRLIASLHINSLQ